jgi:3',5'-nucleoside bisphosphate phosphatase
VIIEADLHIHTTASDGEFTPEEIVMASKAAGLKTIAITDHDSVNAVERALAAGQEAGMEVVPGVEISCVFEGNEVHILGYFIRRHHGELLALLAELEESRHTRMELMIQKANHMGFKIQAEDIHYDGIPGRAHFGRALVRGGYVRDMHEAFSTYLKLNGPLYVPRYDISPGDIIQKINAAGGVASLAHPGLLKDRRIIGKIVAYGVEGIEAYYPLHSKKQVKEFLRLAQKHALVPTGGSDFHGPKNKDTPLGAAGVEQRSVEKLKERIKY